MMTTLKLLTLLFMFASVKGMLRLDGSDSPWDGFNFRVGDRVRSFLNRMVKGVVVSLDVDGDPVIKYDNDSAMYADDTQAESAFGFVKVDPLTDSLVLMTLDRLSSAVYQKAPARRLIVEFIFGVYIQMKQGDQIEAVFNWNGGFGQWKPATIKTVQDDGNYLVNFNLGDDDILRSPDLVRARLFQVGYRVKTRDVNKAVWDGSVEKVNTDGTYRVKLDHQGIVYDNVDEEDICRQPDHNCEQCGSECCWGYNVPNESVSAMEAVLQELAIEALKTVPATCFSIQHDEVPDKRDLLITLDNVRTELQPQQLKEVQDMYRRSRTCIDARRCAYRQTVHRLESKDAPQGVSQHDWRVAVKMVSSERNWGNGFMDLEHGERLYPDHSMLERLLMCN